MSTKNAGPVRTTQNTNTA